MTEVAIALAPEPGFRWRPDSLFSQRIPWFWHDSVVSSSPLPLKTFAALVFLAVYGVAAFFALLSGDLYRFLTDPRFLVPAVSASLSSYVVGYVPRAMGVLWTSLTPWLGNPEELAAFQTAIPALLMRAFWIFAVVILGLFSQWLFVEDPWVRDFMRPDIFHLAYVIQAAAVAYFMGGAAAIATVGLGLFTHRAARVLDLKRGFVLHGGKRALQPFNQLLWVLWVLFALPTIVGGLVNVATSGPAFSSVAWASFAVLLALLSIVVPQLLMNQLLAKEKAQEVQALRAELAETA